MPARSKIAQAHAHAHASALPVECWLCVFECGILTRSDLTAVRLCCTYLRDIANRAFFRAVIVHRAAADVPSIAPFATLITSLSPGLCTLLTSLTIYGGHPWGIVTVTAEQLWIVLNAARAVRTVVLASVYVSGPPDKCASTTARKSIERFSFIDADFESTSTFVHVMVAVGIVGWLHFDRLRVSRGIQLGLGGFSADQLHCKSWVPTARRLSYHSTFWGTAGAFTATFVPADERANQIEELDLSFRFPSRARGAFPLLKACSRLHTLRVYFDLTNALRFVLEDLDTFFEDLPKTSIRVLEVFVGVARHTSPDVMLKTAWKCIGAIPSCTTQVRVGLPATCVPYLLKDGADHGAANWPLLTDVLKSHSSDVTVQFWQRGMTWTADMVDPSVSRPGRNPKLLSYELAHVFRPFSDTSRKGLTERLGRVSGGARVEIP